MFRNTRDVREGQRLPAGPVCVTSLLNQYIFELIRKGIKLYQDHKQHTQVAIYDQKQRAIPRPVLRYDDWNRNEMTSGPIE